MKVTKKELFYNTIADRWDKQINNKETEKRIKIIFSELLSDVYLKNKKVLEVGCGLGYFSQRMSQKGAMIMGIDVGEQLVKITQKKVSNGKFIVGSALDIPFGDNEFDVTLCTEVIEHTENPQKAVSELIRVTKNGGIVVVTTPNKVYKPLFDLLSFLRVRPYRGNENWLGIDELKKCIIKNKREIIKERYFNFFYPTPLLEWFEKFYILRYLMINQGYLIKK